MSRGIRGLLAAALLAFPLALGPVAGAAAASGVSGQVLRLHIVANSDRPDDIAAKVAVRTALLGFLKGRIEGATSLRQAAARLAALTPVMQRIADETLRGYGLKYRARVSLGTAHLPSRRYLGESLSQGRYMTLEVVLGQGRGQNWWCLLFPELCLADAGAAVGSPEGRAGGPSAFLALGRSGRLGPRPAIRPAGLIWRFWQLVRPHEAHLHIARH